MKILAPCLLLITISGIAYAQTQEININPSSFSTIDCGSWLTPLYVLDNKIIPCDSAQAIKADKIEEIRILKGTEAAVLYGSAGSRNGTVVIISKEYATLLNRNKEAEETEKP